MLSRKSAGSKTRGFHADHSRIYSPFFFLCRYPFYFLDLVHPSHVLLFRCKIRGKPFLRNWQVQLFDFFQDIFKIIIYIANESFISLPWQRKAFLPFYPFFHETFITTKSSVPRLDISQFRPRPFSPGIEQKIRLESFCLSFFPSLNPCGFSGKRETSRSLDQSTGQVYANKLLAVNIVTTGLREISIC